MIDLKTYDKAGLLLTGAAVIYFTVLAILANVDLSAGRHVLFMDEHITFDGVAKILHAQSPDELLYQVLDGKEHRYGRILWNVSALFSYFPERLFGVTGQIVATRMVQYGALLTAYLLLANTFLKSWLFRALGLLLLLALPTTDYYATMPKPEPLQLLFIALFLWRAQRNDYAFGYYWLFLGLAFGAKISSLTIIPLFALLGIVVLFLNRKSAGTRSLLLAPLVAGVSFMAGFLAAEPLNLLSIVFRTMNPTRSYIHQTFESTGHGADDISVSWFNWLKHIMEKYSAVPSPLLTVFVILAGLVVVYAIQQLVADLRRSEAPADRLALLRKHAGLLLFVAGLFLAAPIIFKVKRIWDFYLHNGFALMGIGIVAQVEAAVVSHGEELGKRRPLSQAAWGVVILVAIQLAFFMIPASTTKFLALANRTKSTEYLRKISEYNALQYLLNSAAAASGRQLSVSLDPFLFDINSNAFQNVSKFWGPFLLWNDGYDVVIYYKGHSGEGEALPATTSVQYAATVRERELFRQHISTGAAPCLESPCYRLVDTGLAEVRVLFRDDLAALMMGRAQ